MNPDRPDLDEPRADLDGCSINEVMEFRHPLAYIQDRFGLEIGVKRIDLRHTYEGFLAGDLAKMSNEIRTHLPERLKEQYGDNIPIQVVDDGSRVLPGVRVLVFMQSGPTRPRAGDMSELRLCFFLRKREATLDNILDFASKSVEWDKYAKDGDY